MYVLGLMSGTSADGVDASLVEFSGNPDHPQWRLLNTASLEYPSDLREAILSFGQGRHLNSQEILELSESITELHASIAKSCDPLGVATLIGCHGQTVFHRPPNKLQRGASMQLL